MIKNIDINELNAGPKPPKLVHCLVEIPKGGRNKYEYSKEKGVFVLDRVLYGSVFYPTEYGFIPQTVSEDGDALDIMVVTSSPTFSGCLITTHVVGALEITDTGVNDIKIIGVAYNDPRLDHIKSIKDLAPHFKKEVTDFWENYAKLQPKKEIKIGTWHDKNTAYKIVEKAIKAYKKDHD